jgi:uncharacterized phage protein gp47/JayE
MTAYVDLNSSFKASTNLKENLKTKLNISNLRNDSMVNVIGSSIGQEITRLSLDVETMYNQNNYLNAKGADLDRIAFNLYGMQRLSSTYSRTREADFNTLIMLSPFSNYNSFMAANNNQPITIPKGTILTDNISSDGVLGSVQFVTDKDYILSNGSKQYVGTIAITSGSSQNIDKGVIKYINFTNYTDSFNRTLIAGNALPIINGRNPETDDEFRRRIQLFMRSKQAGNYNDITLTSIAVPGVITSEIIPGYYGVGTTGVVIFGPNRLATDKEVDDLQNQINSKYMGMNKIYVSKGFFVLLDLEIRISTRIEVSEVDKNAIKSEIKNIVNSYLMRNENNREVNLNSIETDITRIFRNRNGIEIQMKDNSIFSKKYIRKTTERNASNTVGLEVPSNIIAVQRDERIIINNVDINFDYIAYGV